MTKIEFPLLQPEQISVKVKQVTAKGAVALLYKSARVDMDLLDEVVGPMNWQDQYREIKGNLYCSIGIYCEERNEWIWKEDCGIESAQGDGNEKKAEASDAFKRAGFRWGIGRELYTAPFTFLSVETKQNGSKYELVDKFARFHVAEIDHDEQRRITKLVIADDKGKEVFRFPKGGAARKPDPKPEQPRGSITDEQWKKILKLYTPERIASMLQFYGLNDMSMLSQAQASVIIKKRLKEIENEEMKAAAADDGAYAEFRNG